MPQRRGAEQQDFNSTMVRLKVPPPASPCLSLSDFNSTMVRLKAIARAEMNGKKIYFNSTMVRLKAEEQHKWWWT